MNPSRERKRAVSRGPATKVANTQSRPWQSNRIHPDTNRTLWIEKTGMSGAIVCRLLPSGEQKSRPQALSGGEGTSMETHFSPTRQDVKRYRNLRALAMDLNHRIIKTIPRRAIDDIGRALGILRKGVLVFETEDMSSVLMDCCLYDWFQNGKNVVQRYSEQYPMEAGSDDRFLLDAYLRAKYRVLIGLRAVSGAGLHCRDLLNNEELFLMDVGLSHGAADPGIALATRTLSMGDYWITTGAALPINSDTARKVKIATPKWREHQRGVALSLVRTCLAAGAAEHIRYLEPKT